jgi:cell division initiation protein
MGLTPLDAEKLDFQSGFRGYDRNQVEQFRALVVQTLEGHIRDASELRRRIEELERSIAGFRENEELLRSSMMLAQKTGEDVVAGARREAELIKAEAHADCQEIRNELTRLRAERLEFEHSFHGLLTGFLRRIEQNNSELRSVNADSAAPSVPAAPPRPPKAQPGPAAQVQPLSSPAAPVEPVQRAVPQNSAPPVPADPPVRQIQASYGAGLDRDADIDDFSQALNQAPSHHVPGPAAAAPARPILPPAAADLDEDMDMAAELENFSAQTEYPEDQQSAAYREELPVPEPMAGLEEIESLLSPSAFAEAVSSRDEEDPWEASAEPDGEQWPQNSARPTVAWEPSSPARVQPSRSSVDLPEPGSTTGSDSIPRQIAASNLDDIFGGQPGPAASEAAEDDMDPAPPPTW